MRCVPVRFRRVVIDDSRSSCIVAASLPRTQFVHKFDGGLSFARSFVVSVVVVVVLGLSGCRHYSFTGASIPEGLVRIAIPLVEDNSVNTLSSLDESFTDMLVQRFVRQTRLQLETDEASADALLSARITRYTNVPTSVGGNEVATLNRVTISVSVVYSDQGNNREMLNRSFSGFDEYDPAGAGGLSGELDAASSALTKIADDIFTAATSNW